MKRIIEIGEGQCLIDVAMQYCGNALRVFDIAALNDLLSITDIIEPGTLISIPETWIEDQKAEAVYSDTGLYPASVDEVQAEILDGIDYWIIEEDFVVS